MTTPLGPKLLPSASTAVPARTRRHLASAGLVATIVSLSACDPGDPGTPLAAFDGARLEMIATYEGDGGAVSTARLEFFDSNAVIDLDDDSSCPHFGDDTVIFINGVPLAEEAIDRGGMFHPDYYCPTLSCHGCGTPELDLSDTLSKNFRKYANEESIEIEVKQDKDTITFSAPFLKNFDLEADETITTSAGSRVPLMTIVGDASVAEVRIKHESKLFCPSPHDADSNNDGVLDGANVPPDQRNVEYLDWVTIHDVEDADNDGLSDIAESFYRTDPYKQDSDQDGLTDKQEIECDSDEVITTMFRNDDQLSFIVPPYLRQGTWNTDVFVMQSLPVTCSLETCTATAEATIVGKLVAE